MDEKFFDLQRFGVINNSTANTLISGTNGNDSIKNDNDGDNVTIESGNGNDTINNYGWGSNSSASVVIDSGEGNDNIKNYGRRVSINAGSGDNYIFNDKYNSRSFTIEGSYDSSQDHDAYTKYSSYYRYYQYGGYYVTIKSGDGNDTIINDDGYHVKINAGAGSNYVSLSSGEYVDLNTGKEDDTIKAYSVSLGTFNVGDGNNIISVNGGASINVVSGAGDDSIYNSSSDTSINSGAGDDTINNRSGNVSINGDAGNDSIYTNRDNVSVSGGVGNDTIKSNGAGVLFLYSAGDGNDVIESMSATDTLQIGNGTTDTYSSTVSGNDIIVTVGDGQITIVGGVNIGAYVEGVRVELPIWRIDGTTATYGTINNPLVTVIGVKSLDGISLNGTIVTVDEAALNESNVAISNGYLLTLAGGVTSPQTTPAHWEFNDSSKKAIYKSDKTDAGYSLINGQIIYTPTSGGTDLITVEGVKSKDGLTLSGKTVTVANSALNQEKVTISDGYTLALASDVETPTTLEAHFEGDTYKSEGNTAGYKLVDNEIVYTGTKSAETLFTLMGANITNAITVDTANKTVKLTAANLTQSTVAISDNSYKLLMADDVPKPQTTEAGWTLNGSTATYKNSSISAGYSLNYNQIVYNAASGGETVVTVSGVKSKDGLSLNGQTVTVGAAALNQNAVTVSNGYYLDLADDVTKSTTTAADWSISGDVATYKDAVTSTGYSVVNNQIVYKTASGGETLLAVKGVRSLNGINLNGTTVTISANALNQSAVTVSDGYYLALADDVTLSEKTAAGWTINGNVATYKSASTSAGYSIANNQVVYTPNSGGNALITVSGVKSTDGLTLSGTTVTVSASALDQSNVSISEGYTLALANDVPKSTTSGAGWTINGTTATYKTAATSAGYQLVNNQILYKSDSVGDNLVTVNGVKSKDGLSLSGNVVTVAASALGQSNVSVNSGYTLALANDVPKSKMTSAGWKVNGTTATYKAASTSAGYSVVNNQIICNEASGGESLIKITNFKSLDGISINGKDVTVSKAALGTGKVKVKNDYNVTLAEDVPNPKTTKAWAFNKKTKAATYIQTTTAGYTLANNSITYSAKTTKNLITVNGVKSKSGLSVNGKVVTVAKAALGTANVTVSDGYTLALAKNVAKPKTTAAKWAHEGTKATYKSTGTTAGYLLASDGKSITYSAAKAASTVATINGVKETATPAVKGKVITLTKNNLSSNKVTVDGNGYEFNFAKGDYKKTAITGSKNADAITTNGNNLSIAGGKGNDTLKVAGNTTTITGGAGKDVFVYESGKNNVIADYAEEDKISIVGSAKISTSGKDVVFTVGKNKLTVKGGKDKKITYTDNTGENIYDSGITTSDMAIQLLDNYSKSSYTIAKGEQIKIVDGSAVQRDIKITGNERMNSIVGGSGNDTLTGGGSNDTLTGGKGSDIFVYANGDGNDVITDYTSDDRIKITSGTATVKKNGKDIIFTVGNGKITLKDAADKVVTYLDAKGKTNYYPKPTKDSIVINGTDVTVLEEYKSDTFDVGNVKNGNKVKRIDASPVSHDLKIIGNAKANVILGGYGNDMIYGGKNNDTLQGGDGKDIFVYESGDGKDVILDYNSEDTIKITKGTAKVTTKGSDVVFTVDSGKITLQNAADKTITYIEGDKKKTYGPSASFIVDDNDYELSPNLSSLIQSKTADCSFLSTSNNLAKKDNLIAYSGKK